MLVAAPERFKGTRGWYWALLPRLRRGNSFRAPPVYAPYLRIPCRAGDTTPWGGRVLNDGAYRLQVMGEQIGGCPHMVIVYCR